MDESRFDFNRRHPLCPYCGYDLTASFTGRLAVCPECGEEVERQEARWQMRPGDWTLARGLRRALLSLIIRAAPAAAIWFAYLWFHAAVVRATGGSFRRHLVAAIVPGLLIGFILSKWLTAHAGFASRLLAVLAIVFAGIAMAIGTVLVHICIQPLTSAVVFPIAIGALSASAVIVWINTLES